jgi:hypothetical protein
VLIGGGIVIAASIPLLFIYSLASLAESMPTNISTKNIIKSALNVNQTPLKQSLRHIGIDIRLVFFGIFVGINLMVNGFIALIGGTVLYSSMIGGGANIDRFLDDI